MLLKLWVSLKYSLLYQLRFDLIRDFIVCDQNALAVATKLIVEKSRSMKSST